MARRGRSLVLSLFLGAAALLMCWQLLSPAFLQPKQNNRGLEAAAPAALGALASMAGTMPAEALKGPLTGSDLCTKPLIYLIYPLCDPLFLVCPLYNFPLVLGFFAALVTVINLILPETQPDEDLRDHIFQLCTMARRGRSLVLSLFLGAAALLMCWQLLSPAFLQPKQNNRGLEAAAPAALGALASMAGTMPAEALKGPLTGSDLCTKPLIYLIYPLCDPLFLVCPLYNFPLVLGFFAALVTVINLILPETQPDE
ncbi:Uncharacterized protein SCF082_LOCUS34134, partial [Durusdinium trenchii]